MYLRLIAALLSLVLLAATHWKVYVQGQAAVRAEYRTKALIAEQNARAREHALAHKVETIDHELQTQKARIAAVNRAHAERLREYQSALDRAHQDSAPTGGAAGPFARIAGECGQALAALDQHDRELATTARALQSYATNVCMSVPSVP
jgi:hypothetical protein